MRPPRVAKAAFINHFLLFTPTAHMASTASRLWPDRSERWLWFAGMPDSVTEAPHLQDMIEAHRQRDGGGAAHGTVSVKRFPGGCAWVRFSSPAFAQSCVTALNGHSIPGGVLRVRYQAKGEDTTAPPAIRYVKRSPGAPAPVGTVGAARSRAPSGDAPPQGNGARPKEEGDADDGSSSSKRIKTEGAPESGPGKTEASPAATPNGVTPNGAAANAQPPSPSREAAMAGPPLWDGGPGTNADVLRLALSKLDVDVALNEIVYFLTNDERLPGRTRKAVQFLNGLREQMVQHETQASNPELFDCPFAQAAVKNYTFREVRQCYGEGFRDKFWPVFQAFNCVLPAHAPEEDEAGQSDAGSVSAFLPPAAKK